MIHKALVPLRSLAEWKTHAPPKSAVQWKEGRSAVEMARAWLTAEPPALPPEVEALLASHPDFGPVEAWEAEPEALVPFDGFSGPANVDLLLRARDPMGKIVVAVEGKADESFGATLGETFSAALERKLSSPNSKGVARIEQLARALLHPRSGRGLPRVGDLRYQLLTVSAAALAEAERQGVGRAVVVVHEFRTELTADDNLARNQRDLDRFLKRISRGEVTESGTGRLHGPFRVPGGTLFGDGSALYLGKAVRERRS
jgi:hypothetical protein